MEYKIAEIFNKKVPTKKTAEPLHIETPKDMESEYKYHSGAKRGDYSTLEGAWGEPVYLPKVQSDVGSPDTIEQKNLMNIRRGEELIEGVKKENISHITMKKVGDFLMPSAEAGEMPRTLTD